MIHYAIETGTVVALVHSVRALEEPADSLATGFVNGDLSLGRIGVIGDNTPATR